MAYRRRPSKLTQSRVESIVRALVPSSNPTQASSGGGVSGAGAADPASGIVALDANVLHEWKLNETSGTTFANTGSAGPSATLSTAGAPVTGRLTPIGNGLQFVGLSADKLTGAGSYEPNASLFAVELWFLPKHSQGTTYGQLFGKAYRNDTSWTAPFAAIDIAVNSSNDGRLFYALTKSGVETSWVTDQNYPYVSGRLNNIVLTFDGSHVQFILNGDLIATQAWSGSVDFGTHGQWFIGDDTAGGNEALFGIVNHVRVHSGTIRTLSYWQNQWRAVMGWSS